MTISYGARATTFGDGSIQKTAGLTGFRNRFINGAMVFDQRNNGASVSVVASSNAVYLDRWVIQAAQSAKMNARQNDAVIPPPVGYVSFLGITSASNYSAISTDYFDLIQIIEGCNIADTRWGTPTAKSVALSFVAYSSTGGTFSGSIANNSGSHSYQFTYTLPSGIWTPVTIKIPGPTVGTWNATAASIGIIVRIVDLGGGLNFRTSTVGSWQSANYHGVTGTNSLVATNGSFFGVTGCQFEVSGDSTPFEIRPYGIELALCQRYYQRGSGTASAYSPTNGTTFFVPTVFPVVMQSTPTVINTPAGGGNYTSVTSYIPSTSSYAQNCVVTTAGIASWGYSYTASAEF